MLREMSEEERRAILRAGVQQDADPASKVGHRLREMSPEDFAALARGRHGISNQIVGHEN